MHNPTPEQFYKVADILRQAVKKYPKLKLDMGVSDVNFLHKCGTVHCFGGTAALILCDLYRSIFWDDGAEEVAKSIGFNNRYELKIWASQHCKIWGNKYGLNMFVTEAAFTPGDKTHADDVLDIADHFIEVGDRMYIWNLFNKK